ncbi:MAG: outer membrane beta-barrel protein [Hyphomonadaceae bacterium]|nr:outer membrane beta-barrel protein [Hyphomonadaceae bacterium]
MVSALALTGVAYAQTPPSEETANDCTPQPTCAVTVPESSSDRVIYEAAHFNQYNPQNALDMVNQTPGFTLNGGDDRRGFSGAVGNLLIDGLRPSTKSQSLEGILSRIPSNQVVRIEVLRGGAVAGDASGQSVLLNVVRTPTAGSGLWEAGFELTSHDGPAPRGEVSYSGRNGQIEYGLGISYFSQNRDLPGWRRFYDDAGNYTGRAETPSPREFREAAVTGNLAFPLWGGRLSATAQVDSWEFHADSDFFFFDAVDDPTFSLLTDFNEDGGGLEFGLNYDRDFGPWQMGLIGLINRGRYESSEDVEALDGLGALDSTQLQEVQQETGETILRGSLARALSARHRFEFGGEVAFNTLDQTLAFTIDDGGGPTPVVIPNSNVLVEEERAELFGSYTWRPSDRWTLETRLAWETSTLTFTGEDDESETELSFWKPSIQLSRTFGENNQARFRIYRDVGQLDFGDFVSAAAIADALIAGGNTGLEPPTSWRAEIGTDFRFEGGAALSVTFAYHDITDAEDLVLLSAPNPDEDPFDPDDDFIFFDAPGNIGDAELWVLNVNYSTPVSFIPGGRLTVQGYLRESEVTDPVTGDPRTLSYTPESQIEITFRQDIPSWRFAWGLSAFKQGEFQAYRFNEIDTSEEGPWIDIWAETTALPGNTRLRVWAANAFDGTIERDRRFYDPDRTGGLLRSDVRQRQFAQAPWLIVELSGRF